MNPIETIAAQARASGLRPWIAIKERLAERIISVIADQGSGAVLQGGAALHFAYGSPRLSADVDFVGVAAREIIERSGEPLVKAAQELFGFPASWSFSRAGRLVRGKLTIEVDPARRLVLPIEAYDVPAHRAHAHGVLGDVEDPEEIAADKIVASADRLARRGTLKTTDLFDLWYVCARLKTKAPDLGLVTKKAADYGQVLRGADLAAAVRAIPEEELRAALEGVLPSSEAQRLELHEIIETVATLIERYQHVL